jgi:hypothetical protein
MKNLPSLKEAHHTKLYIEWPKIQLTG